MDVNAFILVQIIIISFWLVIKGISIKDDVF